MESFQGQVEINFACFKVESELIFAICQKFNCFCPNKDVNVVPCPKWQNESIISQMTLPKKIVTLSRIVEISPSVFDSLEVEINQQSMMVVVDKSKHGTHFIKTKLLSVKLCCVCKHLFSG